MNARKGHLVLLVTLLLVVACNADGELRKNFYKKSCPQAEKLVRDITWSKSQADPSLGAKLLRLHFHDCFVQLANS
ncbi:hypothetical protein NL676_020860 [Syzygium grande]|nr:hypothetical protein NL676_020860 [Syzygium grande]